MSGPLGAFQKGWQEGICSPEEVRTRQSRKGASLLSSPSLIR
jgi:hypothetical protein